MTIRDQLGNMAYTTPRETCAVVVARNLTFASSDRTGVNGTGKRSPAYFRGRFVYVPPLPDSI